MSTTLALEPERRNVIRLSTVALKRWSSYELPAELDRRTLDLGERKAELNSDERNELLAWIDFTQQKSIDKLTAEVALQQMEAQFPEA